MVGGRSSTNRDLLGDARACTDLVVSGLPKLEFPKIGVPYLGVLIIRILLSRVLY